MANVGFATLSVIPSFNGFQSRLERGVNPGLTRAGTLGGARFGDAAGRSAGQRFGSTFRTAARAGIIGGLAVAAGAIKIGSDAIGEAREAQQVARQTNAVLKSTGRSARVSAKDVGRLAGRLSYMAGVDDELIQSGENVLLTFKNVRNEAGKGNKIFDRATEVALDMSTALGTDLKGANIQLGKALNDPVKGITALTRVGVTFTEQQKDQIKTLVESGDTLSAQKIVLQELTSEFGGSARSQASATDRLKVAFGNVEEELGKALLPLVQDFARFLLRKGVPAAQAFSDWFTKKGVPAIKDLGRKLRPLAEELLPAAGDAFKAIKGFAEDALPFAEGIVGAFNDMPGWVKKVLIGGTLGTTFALKLGAGSLAKALGGSLFSRGSSPANPLWVQSVTGGTGGGVPTGKPSTTTRLKSTATTAAKGGILAVTVYEGLKGDKALGDAIWHGLQASVIQGGSRASGGPASAHPDSRSFAEIFGTTKDLNSALDTTHGKFVVVKRDVDEFGGKIRERIPRIIPFDMPGVRSSKRDVDALIAALLEARSIHVDTRLDRVSGSGSGSVSLPPTPHQEPPTRGVTITVEKVEAQDVNGLLRDLQGRAHRAGSDGIRR